MKRLLAAAAALTISGIGHVQGVGGVPVVEKGKIVSIDSLMIMQKSLEGKELSGKIQQEIDGFQVEIKKAQQELSDKQETLNKQSKVLSKDAFDQKSEELASTRKSYEHTFAAKEEGLRASIQKQQLALRDRQMKVISNVFDQEGYAAIFDKNAPGLLFVSNALDKTDYVLKTVDDKFAAATKATVVAKAPAAGEAKIKTA